MKAVVFVDCQNDFLKGGALGYGHPNEDIAGKLRAFAHYGREQGWMLYATADTHEPTAYDVNKTPTTGYLATLEGKKLPVEHCIEGTDGHKIVEGLVKDGFKNVIIPQGHIVDKKTFGSFDLLARIDQDFVVDDAGKLTHQSKYDGIGESLDEIILVGVCTSICVISNALMLRAKYPNVEMTVYEDLCGDIDEASHNAALQVMRNCQINVARRFNKDDACER